MEYTPDAWKILKISGGTQKPFYKVFATWYGGFAGTDSWKLSSGFDILEDVGTYYIARNYSGSVYYLRKGAEGVTSSWNGLYAQFLGTNEYVTEVKV